MPPLSTHARSWCEHDCDDLQSCNTKPKHPHLWVHEERILLQVLYKFQPSNRRRAVIDSRWGAEAMPKIWLLLWNNLLKNAGRERIGHEVHLRGLSALLPAFLPLYEKTDPDCRDARAQRGEEADHAKTFSKRGNRHRNYPIQNLCRSIGIRGRQTILPKYFAGSSSTAVLNAKSGRYP